MVKKPVPKKAAPARSSSSSSKAEKPASRIVQAAPAASSTATTSRIVSSTEAPRIMPTVSSQSATSSSTASRTVETVSRTVEPIRTVSAASSGSASNAPLSGSASQSYASNTPTTGAAPSMRIVGQYLKDLSFENPNAPQSLAPQTGQPDINISVNVNANSLGGNDFEVELQLEAKATGDDKTLFAAEVLYAGIFKLENFPQNVLHAAVLIECPRMLFPFARQILADATRNGGFPPLMLDPIDFASMYQQRMRQQQST